MSRPLPPPLPVSDPPCPICRAATEYDDGTYICRDCESTWDENGQASEWQFEDAGQCRSVYTSTNPTAPADGYRCLRNDGHADERHYNPDCMGHWLTGGSGVSEVTR